MTARTWSWLPVEKTSWPRWPLELDPDGERTAHRATDITDPDSCASLVQLAQERFGSVDALIQVAAFEHAWGGLYDLKLDDWRAAFDTNVLGALTLLRPVAKRHEGGRRRVGRLHRLAVHVQAGDAASRLRGLQERAADGDLLPGRRARAGQHPLQHGDPLVDVGPQRRALRFRERLDNRAGPKRRSSTTWSPTSRSDG